MIAKTILQLLVVSCLLTMGPGCSELIRDLGPGPDRVPESITVNVNLAGPTLSTQQNSLWCWAASIANLFAYYGHPVSQARIVSEVYGAPVNMRSGDYSNLARLLNRSWRDDRNQPFTVTLNAALDVPNGVNTITNDQIRDALRANMPLVVGTTQHAMLVVGMTYTEVDGHVDVVHAVRVFDPWPGMGLRTLSPSEMTSQTRGGSLLFIALARVS
jgi:hypothetical protein